MCRQKFMNGDGSAAKQSVTRSPLPNHDIMMTVLVSKHSLVLRFTSMVVGTRFSQGASVKGLMVSSSSIAKFLSTSATSYSGERCCLLNFRIRDVLRPSGLVSGSVWISVHSLMILLQNRSCAGAIETSASATLVATVRNVPTIACAPIL